MHIYMKFLRLLAFLYICFDEFFLNFLLCIMELILQTKQTEFLSFKFAEFWNF